MKKHISITSNKMKDRSKYNPSKCSNKQEKARRKRQIEKGIIQCQK